MHILIKIHYIHPQSLSLEAQVDELLGYEQTLELQE